MTAHSAQPFATSPTSETSSLLQHAQDNQTLDSAPPPTPHPSATQRKASSLRLNVTIIILLLILTTNFPYHLQVLPRFRIWEIIYCRKYYQEHDPSLIGPGGVVEERYCKIENVQSQIALLKGWFEFFSGLPGLFLAIPYGMLADRYGRKGIITACLAAIWVEQGWIYVVSAFPDTFPLRLIWLSPIVTIIGGGDLVVASLVFTVIYDVTPQAKSASSFFYLGAAIMLASIVAPILAGILMARDPWISMTLGLSLQLFSIPTCLMLPETLGLDKEEEEENPLLPASTETPITPRSFAFPSLRKQSFWFRAASSLQTFLKDSSFLISDWRITFLVLVSPLDRILGFLDEFLPQYVSDRYSWTLANSVYITAFNSVATIITLLVILPLISAYLERHRFDTSRKDLLILRVSLIFQTLGLLGQGLAPNTPLLALGLLIAALASGGVMCRRALTTSYVHKGQVARLYSIIAVLDVIAASLTGPIVAAIFSGGLKKGGGIWLGIPWTGMGIVSAVLGLSYWCLDWGDKEEGRGVEPVVLDGLAPESSETEEERERERERAGDGGEEEDVMVSGRMQHERTSSLRKVTSR